MISGGHLLGCALFRTIVVLALGLGLTLGARAGSGTRLSAQVGDHTVEVWQIEDGLPQISVTSIAQTPDGYLWLGTFNGLARFDGVRFAVFDEGNTPALGSSRIVRLEVDSDGILWIVTETGGLARLAAGRFTTCQRADGLPESGAGFFVRDAARRLLLLDRERGLHRIDHGQVRPLARGDRLLSEDEPSLLCEGSGPAWIGQQGKATQSGLRDFPVLIGDGTNTSRTNVIIESAVLSRAGGWWLASTTGVYRLEDDRLRGPLAPRPPIAWAVALLVEDGMGQCWAGRWDEALFRWEPRGQWQRFGQGAGLADKNLNVLFADREGNLWVGTGQGGLHRFKPRLFHVYDTQDGLAGPVVTSLAGDRQGRMWIGVGGGGLHCWQDGRIAPVTEPARLRDFPLVYSVLADHQDAVWIGLYGGEVLRLRDGTVERYPLGTGTPGPATPWVLFEDRAGTVWAGCNDGLRQYRAGRFTRYTRQEGLSHDEVRALAEDRGGTLYIGTGGGGLNCLRAGRFTGYTERDGLADNHISALHVTGDDTLWIGTFNGGLSRFKSGQFANLTTRDGLPSNTIGSLLEDDQANLWVGLNRGIVRIPLKELDEYLAGHRRRLAWHAFGRSDGLNSLGCGGIGQPGCWKARDGKLWFATVQGAAVVDPQRLPFNPLPPPVVIEEVVLDDRSLDRGPSTRVGIPESEGEGHSPSPPAAAALLTIPPHTHRVEFRFTGLSLVAPEKVRFRYRLEDFDGDWIEAGTRRAAYYTRIPPGRYRFRVTACNNDGVWNETGASLALLVLPPWWRTWWCRAGAGLAAVGLSFWWVELRLRRLRREHAAQTAFAHRLIQSQEEERKRIAAELHDGLGQNLLVIKNRAVLGLQETTAAPNATEQFDEISRMASHTLEEVREISRNLRPFQIDRLGLTKAIESMVTGVARTSGLPWIREFDPLDGLLRPQYEIHLYRIVQELLNNVVKHSDASACRVALKHQGRSLILTVEDDGRGFDYIATAERPTHEPGMGLSGIMERIRILGGTAQCETQPGQGTRWRMVIPLEEKSKR